MRPRPILPAEKLIIVRWPTAQGDLPPQGLHDARSTYVERYWLGILGPSATFLLRHLNDELDANPAGVLIRYDEVSAQMGTKGGGKNSPFMRALTRLCQFEMTQMIRDDRRAVRAHLPTLARRHVARLPEPLRQRHDFYVAQRTA